MKSSPWPQRERGLISTTDTLCQLSLYFLCSIQHMDIMDLWSRQSFHSFNLIKKQQQSSSMSLGNENITPTSVGRCKLKIRDSHHTKLLMSFCLLMYSYINEISKCNYRVDSWLSLTWNIHPAALLILPFRYNLKSAEKVIPEPAAEGHKLPLKALILPFVHSYVSDYKLLNPTAIWELLDSNQYFDECTAQ